MTIVALPLTSDAPRSSFECELENRVCRYTFDWSTRESAWYLNVQDVDGAYLAAGVKLLLGLPLFLPANAALPPGDFVVIDTTGSGVDAGLTDLGNRIQLLYVPSGDL